LTGETGAGKSIILNGISLLIGERSHTDMIRNGAQGLFAEGVFELNENQKKRLSQLVKKRKLVKRPSRQVRKVERRIILDSQKKGKFRTKEASQLQKIKSMQKDMEVYLITLLTGKLKLKCLVMKAILRKQSKKHWGNLRQ